MSKTILKAAQEPNVVRTGLITFKREGGLLSGGWSDKELVLTDAALFVRPPPTPSSKRKHIPIALPAITALERVEDAPACLLLSVAKPPSPKPTHRYLLSFRTDSELYDWQDEIYARAPKLGGWSSGPFDFVHEAHVGYESNLDQLPSAYTDMLGVKSKAAASAAAEKVKIPQSSSTVKSKPQDDDDDSPALVLEGRASVKHQGAFSWFWKERWLVLAGGVLSVKRSKTSPTGDPLPLTQLVSLTRVVNSKRPYCLLLELRDGRRVLVSFLTDKELYAWNDAMYLCFAPEGAKASSPKTKSSATATTKADKDKDKDKDRKKRPVEGAVHHVHVGVDKDGEFTSELKRDEMSLSDGKRKLDPKCVREGVRRSIRDSLGDVGNLKETEGEEDGEEGTYPTGEWKDMGIPLRQKQRRESGSDTAVVRTL